MTLSRWLILFESVFLKVVTVKTLSKHISWRLTVTIKASHLLKYFLDNSICTRCHSTLCTFVCVKDGEFLNVYPHSCLPDGLLIWMFWCFKSWVVPPPSLGLLLQDAPLSDCTDTIDGLDVSEGSYSPAKSIRKVLTAPVTNTVHPYLTSSLSHSSEPADRRYDWARINGVNNRIRVR